MSDDYQLRKDIDRMILDLYTVKDENNVVNVYTKDETYSKDEIDRPNGLLKNFVDNGTLYDYVSKEELLDLVYPIGCIYMTVNDDDDPSDLFGGLWEEIESSLGFNVWKRVPQLEGD